jgi:ribosomal protein S18 acetylase RimI-like enzyme
MAAYAAELVKLHHGWDAARYFLVPDVARGYRSFFRRELEDAEAVLAVAEHEGRVVGYVYGRLEPRDWNALLDEAGKVHDIFVDPAMRGRGHAQALLAFAYDALGALGARRVVLHVATQNEAGRALFTREGFRPTLMEMTKELPKRA